MKREDKLEEAKRLYQNANAGQRYILESLFPELRETEDEKIRKWLIGYFQQYRIDGMEVVYANSLKVDDILAWLEKQKGTKDKEEISTSVNVQKKKATGVLGEMIANINPESLQKTKEQMIAEVEQQIKGCIGMILTDVNERRFEDFGVTLKECLEWLEKQGEQKPTDKTEPRFKVGDWVVGDEGIFKITQYEDDNGYNLTALTGCVVHFVLPDYVESNYHLWTINDAKDGDVLMTAKPRNCPFIYRKTDYNNNLAYYYAGISGNGDFCEGCLKRTMSHFGSVVNIIPATKEQCDLLFQKMKDAGYEWDADKKRLTKKK